MRKINKIVVHCSDSDNPKHDNIETIRQWHTERGFIGPDGISGTLDDIGYHWIITQDGTIHQGRPESKNGAHVKGHNSDSIGICLTGSKKTVASESQLKALNILLKNTCARYNLRKLDVLAHNDLDKGKSCPIFDLAGFLATIEWH